MDLRELQERVTKNAQDYSEKYNVKIDKDFALLKLYEEVGEFAQAMLIHQKKCRPEKYLRKEDSKEELARELADVLGMVMVNANLHGIDLMDSMNKKWLNKE